MPTIIDLTDGSSITHSKDGLQATRVALVTGLSGDANARMYAALSEPGIPVRGDAHPIVPGLKAVTITAQAAGPESARVTVVYKPFTTVIQPPGPGQPPQIEVGSTVQEVVTNKDIAGNQIFLEHEYVDDQGNPTGRVEQQSGELTVQVPLAVRRCTRLEVVDPTAKARTYVGKVNAGAYFGGAARTWLCKGIVGRSDDGGTTYLTHYEFQYNPATWDATVVFIDPATDRPPPGLVDGVGIKVVQVYQAVDFGGLGL